VTPQAWAAIPKRGDELGERNIVSGIYERLGVPVIVNAKGTATRLSGGIMHPEVSAAMVEASTSCVDMVQLHAAASRRIAAATGAESGLVTAGAAAALMLAAAATMAGLDPAAMASLPKSHGRRHEIVMVRSQRNAYDHAIRTAGARIVEVGLLDRFAGAGERDTDPWEIAAAIGERTAAVLWVADTQARPPLAAVIAVAHERGVPVIVDAAAELPPKANLRRFIEAGADLVAFSGGKALGGPQASGILAGRRDLVMSAALQQLDLDMADEVFTPPAAFIDKSRLPGLPRNGVGRVAKVGKEEIAGLMVALERFMAESDEARVARWSVPLEAIRAGLPNVPLELVLGPVPRLRLDLASVEAARDLERALRRSDPAIFVEPADLDQGRLWLSPLCLREADPARIVAALGKPWEARKP
jgi:D-glucosaminate-6-phosphate ammonia-lyase